VFQETPKRFAVSASDSTFAQDATSALLNFPFGNAHGISSVRTPHFRHTTRLGRYSRCTAIPYKGT
jgi:hypothetical protein